MQERPLVYKTSHYRPFTMTKYMPVYCDEINNWRLNEGGLSWFALILYHFIVMQWGLKVCAQKMFHVSFDKSVIKNATEYSVSVNYSVIAYYLGDYYLKRKGVL